MRQRKIILTAKFLSKVFTPFYLPVVGMVVLFTLSYLSLLPPLYKIMVLLTVWLFTIFLPTMLIKTYNRYQNWRPFEIGTRERRMIPYVISMLCYLLCTYVMTLLHIPHFMCSIVIAALTIQIIFLLQLLFFLCNLFHTLISCKRCAELCYNLSFITFLINIVHGHACLLVACVFHGLMYIHAIHAFSAMFR